MSGFLDKNTVVTTGQKVPSVYVNPEPRVFPAISFSCNGWISAWIFASKLNASLPSGSHLVNLQLWRGEKAFTKATEVTIQQTDISCSEGNLHKVYLQTPMEFHAGDFLGIDQQISASNAELLIYDQQFNGPPNFSGSHEFSTIDILTPLPNNDFPLITIETTTIGKIKLISKMILYNFHNYTLTPMNTTPDVYMPMTKTIVHV